MKQLTLEAVGFERYAKTTRRAVFLDEMERVVPWPALSALIDPFYAKPGNGRPPIGVERMRAGISCAANRRSISETRPATPCRPQYGAKTTRLPRSVAGEEIEMPLPPTLSGISTCETERVSRGREDF
jgi:hypothetical protein